MIPFLLHIVGQQTTAPKTVDFEGFNLEVIGTPPEKPFVTKLTREWSWDERTADGKSVVQSDVRIEDHPEEPGEDKTADMLNRFEGQARLMTTFRSKRFPLDYVAMFRSVPAKLGTTPARIINGTAAPGYIGPPNGPPPQITIQYRAYMGFYRDGKLYTFRASSSSKAGMTTMLAAFKKAHFKKDEVDDSVEGFYDEDLGGLYYWAPTPFGVEAKAMPEIKWPHPLSNFSLMQCATGFTVEGDGAYEFKVRNVRRTFRQRDILKSLYLDDLNDRLLCNWLLQDEVRDPVEPWFLAVEPTVESLSELPAQFRPPSDLTFDYKRIGNFTGHGVLFATVLIGPKGGKGARIVQLNISPKGLSTAPPKPQEKPKESDGDGG